MYRQSDATSRCPMCTSTDLTPATGFRPLEGSVDVYFKLRKAPKSIWTSDTEAFRVDRARVCLACGHVSLALSPQQLAKLREKLPSIVPAH